MNTVGTTEIRKKLSYFLNLVKNGANLVITDRGRAVAKIVPVNGKDSGHDSESILLRLSLDGTIRTPFVSDVSLNSKIKKKFCAVRGRKKGKASEILQEMRNQKIY